MCKHGSQIHESNDFVFDTGDCLLCDLQKTPVVQYKVDPSQYTVEFYGIGRNKITDIQLKLNTNVLIPSTENEFLYQVVNSGGERLIVTYQTPNGRTSAYTFDIVVAEYSWIIMVIQYDAMGQQVSYNYY